MSDLVLLPWTATTAHSAYFTLNIPKHVLPFILLILDGAEKVVGITISPCSKSTLVKSFNDVSDYTLNPTDEPTQNPTHLPSRIPTAQPTAHPSLAQTESLGTD